MTSHVFWPFFTYLPTLSYSITSNFGGYLGPTLPTLISDIINGRSLGKKGDMWGVGGTPDPPVSPGSTGPAWLEVTFSSVFLAGNLLCVSADKKNLGH